MSFPFLHDKVHLGGFSLNNLCSVCYQRQTISFLTLGIALESTSLALLFSYFTIANQYFLVSFVCMEHRQTSKPPDISHLCFFLEHLGNTPITLLDSSAINSEWMPLAHFHSPHTFSEPHQLRLSNPGVWAALHLGRQALQLSRDEILWFWDSTERGTFCHVE